MNELSAEVKAKETHENAIFYHNRTEENLYRFIMEVKKIRDNRYYKELGFSNFDEYCAEAWNVDRKFMSERISIAEQFNEDDFVVYSRQLGHKKTLFLARMDEQQREKATTKGIPTDEGYKTVDEATQKEIAEYRRNAEEAERRAIEAEQAKQQAEAQAKTAYESEQNVIRRMEELENREPEVIEKEVIKEVIPSTMQEELESTKRQLDYASRELEKFDELKKEFELKKSDFDEEEAEKERKKLEWEADKNVLRLKIKVDKFMEEVAITAFMEGAIAASGPTTKNKLADSVEQMKNFVRKMETVLSGRIEIK